MTDTTISTDPATLRDLAATLRMDEVRVCPHYLKLDLLADTYDAIAAEKEAQADLTRRLAEVTAERDAAQRVIAWANNSLYGSHGFFLSLDGGPADEHHLDSAIEQLKDRARARTAAEAALSRRDEALRAAREALVDYEHQTMNTRSGVRTKLSLRARDIIATIDALTKPQEAADAGENG
jgi:hypothetical protein